jgi:hypothetical protein
MGFYPGMTYSTMGQGPVYPWPGAIPPPPYPAVSPAQRKRFTVQEDALLRQLVAQFPDDSWGEIAARFPGRTTRQVRERYEHYLKPTLNLGKWTSGEDLLLEQKFEQHGPEWSELKQYFPGRSGVNVKNRWTTLLSRKRKQEWASGPSGPETPATPTPPPDTDPDADADPDADLDLETSQPPVRRDSASNVTLIREMDSFGAFDHDLLPFDDVFGGEFHW